MSVYDDGTSYIFTEVSHKIFHLAHSNYGIIYKNGLSFLKVDGRRQGVWIFQDFPVLANLMDFLRQ